jgi:uncharacterized protein (TIGR02145 family)
MLRLQLLTCALLLCATTLPLCAQDVPDCTYNPDFDGDGSIGVTDLLGFLSFYGDENSAGQCSFGPDLDCDGICDAFDDCVGEIDACGICGGSGAFFPVIDTIFPIMDSVYIECLAGYHVFEAWADTSYNYVCPTYGCTDFDAYNYDPDMLVDDGSCLYASPGCSDGTLTVDFDGHAYDLVTIGDQCWFAENLRSSHYANGDSILTGPYSTDESPRWYIPPQASNYVSQKGRLYNWFAVNDERNISPNGWHVPSDLEWHELEITLGMSPLSAFSLGNRQTNNEGLQLKASPLDSPSWDGDNSSGFKGLPGGYGTSETNYVGAEYFGAWWTTTPNNSNLLYRTLTTGVNGVFRGSTSVNDLLSVRCVQEN